MKQCEMCQRGTIDNRLIRLTDSWYCLDCLAAAVRIFSYENNATDKKVDLLEDNQNIVVHEKSWPSWIGEGFDD